MPWPLIDSLQTLLSPGFGVSKTLSSPGFGVMVLLAFLVPVAWRDPLFRKMAIVVGAVLLALTAETGRQKHYGAPVWAALALIIAVWVERAWNLRIDKQPIGIALVLLGLTPPAIVATLSLLLQITSMSFNGDKRNTPIASDYWPNRRAALIEQLSALDRRQLVIVQYPSPDWNVTEEWVYNSADIDHQRVVFAHDLGIEQNRALLNYYFDRTALLLTFDSASGHEQIEPYPLAQSLP